MVREVLSNMLVVTQNLGFDDSVFHEYWMPGPESQCIDR